MRFRDGAKTNCSHGKTNNLAIATWGRQTLIKHRRLGSIWRNFQQKQYKSIQKALGLSLVHDALSQKLKTFVLLRKRDGQNECKIDISKNVEFP